MISYSISKDNCKFYVFVGRESTSIGQERHAMNPSWKKQEEFAEANTRDGLYSCESLAKSLQPSVTAQLGLLEK